MSYIWPPPFLRHYKIEAQRVIIFLESDKERAEFEDKIDSYKKANPEIFLLTKLPKKIT